MGYLDHTLALKQCPHQNSRGQPPPTRDGPGWFGGGFGWFIPKRSLDPHTTAHEGGLRADGCEPLPLRISVSPGQTPNERFANS